MVYHDDEASHWSVGVFRRSLRTIHYFDSLSKLGVEAKAKEACLGTLKWFGVSIVDITWEAKPCKQQTDGVSCGLYLVENVRAVLTTDPIAKLSLDELRSKYQRELSRSTTLSNSHAIPAAAIDALDLPLSYSSKSQDLGCIILRKKMEQHEDLISQANQQRLTPLQQSKMLDRLDTELPQLHTDLMEAEHIRLWCTQNCQSANARLEAFERHPVLPQPGPPSQPATEAFTEYTSQLLALRNRLDSEQKEQRQAIEVVRRKKIAWQACLQLHQEGIK
ncbi:MAG: hypothetical protein Q9219_004313 [cf. Caloplaca sp. 3 TL-2023]